MKTLKIIENGPILSLVLHRPDVRNSMSTEMIAELTQAFQEVSSRPSVRAVLLSGEGAVFCSGADLTDMKRMVSFTFEENQSDALRLHAMFEALAKIEVPVVCEVHGAAYGGALGLMAASDVVIAESETKFCFSEVKLGLAPAVISDFISRKISVNRVAPWMLSGQVFSAAEAHSMGLVHQVSAKDQVKKVTLQMLRALFDAGPEAVRATKKLLRTVPSLSREQARAQTTHLISERRASAEGQEGLAAFFEKREPHWRG